MQDPRRHACRAAGLLLVVLLIGLPSQGCAGDFQEEVQKMVDGVEEAWNAEDPGTLAEMFAETADLNSRNGVWYTGPDEIHGYFEEWIGSTEGNSKEIAVDRSKQLSESIAAVDVVSTLRDREGRITEQVTVSVTVERQLDGSWLFTTWRECQAVR